ncbi:MAG: glutamyl-tRNA reductase [Bacteroidia bacterium]|nr:glutamyl-tRNA reductase [Bacteroidia bacterium]
MTFKNEVFTTFMADFMDYLKIISLTHKSAPLELFGKLHLDELNQTHKLPKIKEQLALNELMFLSTCNRVELIISYDFSITESFLVNIFNTINTELSITETKDLVQYAELFEGHEALNHIFEVSASLDSLVVGEREIITQVRKAYELCNKIGVTGDLIRLVLKQTIETAKRVYTETDIARNPVSVVSLAYRQLRNLGIKNNARLVFVGAGETNANMAKYLKKHEFANLTVFNRTLTNAQKLATELNGTAKELSQINQFNEGFDVLITCTASQDHIITNTIYQSLIGNDTSKKVIIDLALPADVAPEVIKQNNVEYIDIASLKQQATENLHKRESEIAKCRKIIFEKVEEFKHLLSERKIERAFSQVPIEIKSIKELALNEVFAKEIKNLDHQSKEVLEKVLNYMEKKYNALAIKTAKKAFLEEEI